MSVGRFHSEERVGVREVVQVELGVQVVGQVDRFPLGEAKEVQVVQLGVVVL